MCSYIHTLVDPFKGLIRGEQANRKSAKSWAQSAIVNQQNLRCASSHIENPQIFMINPQILQFLQNKYCTTLSQNSPKIRLCKRSSWTNLNWSIVCYICQERKCVLADLRKF
jgi:hypothetical protein